MEPEEVQTEKERQQAAVLQQLAILLDENNNEEKISTQCISTKLGWSHDTVVGVVKSLESREMVETVSEEKSVMRLTSEGASYAKKCTPEVEIFQIAAKAKSEGIAIESLKSGGSIAVALGTEVCDIGMQTCLKRRWLTVDKATKTLRLTPPPKGSVKHEEHEIELHKQVARAYKTLTLVAELAGDGNTTTNEVDELAVRELLSKTTDTSNTKEIDNSISEVKDRRLVTLKKQRWLAVSKGVKFALQVPKLATDLTQSLLASGAWKNLEIKSYNFNAAGIRPKCGSVHPLMRVQKKFKQILLSMGFEEMPTNQWTDTSFWNFDTLFMPQQHPARDIQDTFFLMDPAVGRVDLLPEEYFKSVRKVHERGGYESIGWRYPWSETETMRNLMRTHTTAISARMLYKLGQEYAKSGVFTPKRYFSIDRVFRNERLDETHLAEFHQVEGLVAEVGMNLGHLKGVMRTFYRKIGIESLKFKPAYNPYTEPSMEIFGYHPLLKRWIEVGNSGIFRPEMLRPMGLPEDVTVIAWGLSLERPTMIRYNVKNIRNLFGHKAALGVV